MRSKWRTSRSERKRHPPGEWAKPPWREVEHGCLTVPPADNKLGTGGAEPDERIEFHGKSAAGRRKVFVWGYAHVHISAKVDAARKWTSHTQRLEIRKTFINLPLQLCPLCELVLRARLHELGLGCHERRLELIPLAHFLGVENAQVELECLTIEPMVCHYVSG